MDLQDRPSVIHGRGREHGAGLVLIIGVIAALAVTAAALVALTANVQHNSSDTRQHVKSFVVTEAGLDSGMALLGRSWPSTATTVPTFDTNAFKSRFPVADFPRSTTKPFISVVWFDDQSPVNKAVAYDQNDNGIMWMVSQASVGSRSTRVVSQVQRAWFSMQLPRGIPLWAASDLTSNGQGNNPKIRVEVPPPTGTATTIQVGGTVEETTVTQAGIAHVTGSAISPLEDIFPQELVETLIQVAQTNGRYFTTLAAAEASPVDAVWSPVGGLSGLTVIAPPSPTVIRINGNLNLNTETQPGVLMILGGSNLQWGGTGQYYGVVYCEGPMDTSNGTADIHGMVITNSKEDLKGTPHILYNDNCIANLDRRFPAVARRVPNTWREVQPQ